MRRAETSFETMAHAYRSDIVDECKRFLVVDSSQAEQRRQASSTIANQTNTQCARFTQRSDFRFALVGCQYADNYRKE